jgi:hypothetical protein
MAGREWPVSMADDVSYESRMLGQLAMPTRTQVGRALLRTLLKHSGVVKEFGAGHEVVDQLADEFQLNRAQRTATLETVYRKEDRVKKSLLWHRLLFRAADLLALEGLVSRPTQTVRLTGKREWMLTEKGFDEALRISDIPTTAKNPCRPNPTRFRRLSENFSKLQDVKITDPSRETGNLSGL